VNKTIDSNKSRKTVSKTQNINILEDTHSHKKTTNSSFKINNQIAKIPLIESLNEAALDHHLENKITLGSSQTDFNKRNMKGKDKENIKLNKVEKRLNIINHAD
jgi:hypothetical protein